MRKMFSEKQIRTFIDKGIEADKDIIQKVKVAYADGYTRFDLPVGVVPLSITLNTHRLFFKDYSVVDYQGNPVEGYELDEVIVASDESYITFVGDLSEQVINGLTYIEYSGDGTFPNDTLSLFYPASGTKLYKHQITVSNQDGTYSFYIISTTPEPYTLAILYAELQVGVNCIAISIELALDFWTLSPNGVYSTGINYGEDLVIIHGNTSTTIDVVEELTDTVTEL